ncbi:MAG: hypothetical protein HW421_3104 [Ignavibacteria bacterium]|nr:hypothetical protein [Ignavibacteria bacterium]
MKNSLHIFFLIFASFFPLFGESDLPRIDVQSLVTDFGYVDYRAMNTKQIVFTNISEKKARLYYYMPVTPPFSGTIPMYDTLLTNESKVYNVSFSPRKFGIENQRLFFRAENYTSNAIALLFDVSGSMNEEMTDKVIKLEGAKKAGLSFVDNMKFNTDEWDEAAIYTFSSGFTVRQQLTTNKPALRTAINNMTASGQTSFYFALDTTCSLISSSSFTRVIVALTDGVDNDNRGYTPDKVIAKAKARNIRIFTIGLGTSVDDFNMSRIASETGGAHFKAKSSKELIDIYNDLVFKYLIFNKEFFFDLAGMCKGPYSNLIGGKDTVFKTGDTSKFEFYIGNLTKQIKPGDTYKIYMHFNPNLLVPVLDSSITYNYDGKLILSGKFDSTMLYSVLVKGVNNKLDVNEILTEPNVNNWDSLLLSGIRFVQLLGNEPCTVLHLDSVILNDGEIYTVIKNGLFTICTKTCNADGIRLFLSIANSELFLAQNNPNPCNNTTTVEFGLMEEGYSSFSVYNALGEEMFKTNDIPQKPGKYSLPIDVSAFPQGIYYYVLKTPSRNLSNRMQIIK